MCRKYLFVGLEVMNADSPTGGDRVVLGERERGGSVSPAAALLMDGKINKETEKSICEESIRASEVKFVTDKLPERKRRRGRFIKNTRTAAGTSDLLRHVSVKCPFLTLKQKKKV